MLSDPETSAKWRNLIMEGSRTLGVPLDTETADKFAFHACELLKWNRKMNLTAITDPSEIAVKHFLDSAAPAPVISPGASLLDIGSGGGFPGIPLGIVIPSLSVTMIDSSRKKVSFQKHIIRSLGLRNINARHIRAQELAREPGFANSFDVIICRALTSSDRFVSMALPLLAPYGKMIAMKARLSDEEIASLWSLNGGVSLRIKEYILPYLGLERNLVIINIENPKSETRNPKQIRMTRI